MTTLDPAGVALTAAALVAFAANSILSRAALGDGAIDAVSFSAIRLIAGAVMLLAVTLCSPRRRRIAGSWGSALLLFLYAIPFSVAYGSVSAGSGALILFGAVQITMMTAAWGSGERFRSPQLIGYAVALLGLLVLVSPGATAPPLRGAVLMAIAGAAWGMYSLHGRDVADPLAQTTGNFLRAAPLTAAVVLVPIVRIQVEREGVLLAIASGAFTSGLGYVVWYSALRHLTAGRASIVQLTVPVIAALGGVVFLGESISLRLVAAGVAVLGGVSLAVTRRR